MSSYVVLVEGVINIDRTEQEDMCIYKHEALLLPLTVGGAFEPSEATPRNTQWANFMHGKALKARFQQNQSTSEVSKAF